MGSGFRTPWSSSISFLDLFFNRPLQGLEARGAGSSYLGARMSRFENNRDIKKMKMKAECD